MIHLTRRYRFAAAHRLHARELSAEANREVYGKCNNPYGHGHNYALEVTVAGEPSADGRVVDPRRLDTLVEDQVLRPMSHRDLNREVAEFESLVPTTENLAVVIARRLEEAWQGAPPIHKIRLEETANNSFELILRNL